MSNNTFRSGFGFAVFTVLALFAIIVSIVTFQAHELAQKGGLFAYLAINHLWIMLITMLISIAYGFFWAYVLLQKVKKEESTTKDIFNIVLSFLSVEESHVIKHLVEKKGRSTQSQIAHIQNMGAVKALRTVQKMQDKKLVHIIKHGKVREIILKKNIMELLL